MTAQVIREGDDTILYVQPEETEHASLEDSPAFMARILTMLTENKGVTRIVISQKQDAEYDFEQTRMLQEVAGLYRKLLREKEIWNYGSVSAAGTTEAVNSARWNLISQAVHSGLLSDPLGTYVVLKRAQRRAQIELEKSSEPLREGVERYWTALGYITTAFEALVIYERVGTELEGMRPGDRALYRVLLTPQSKPDFMFTKLLAAYPKDGEQVTTYSIGPTEVSIFKLPGTVQYLYHILPPEFRLSEAHYELLDSARRILAEHKPSREEFVDPKRMREVFGSVGSDLIEELAQKRGEEFRARAEKLGAQVAAKESELAAVLARYGMPSSMIAR